MSFCVDMRLNGISSDEQPTQEVNLEQQGRRSYTSLLWWAPLLMFVLLLISVLSGRSAIEAWISHHVTHNQTPSPTVSVIHPQPTPPQLPSLHTTEPRFEGAMLDNNC